MAEQLLGLPVSPYKEVFNTIETLPDCTSHDAYMEYCLFLRAEQLDPSIYLSMAITSGGFARDPDLSFGEAMDRNGLFGSQVAAQLANQFAELDISTRDIIVPSDLGKVPGWNQADYLIFWAHVITGLDAKEATRLDWSLKDIGVSQLPGFTDSSLSREEKWRDSKQLIDTYVAEIERLGLGQGNAGARLPRNIQTIFLILDAQQSLGVNAERYLCYKLGLGEYGLDLVTSDESYRLVDQELRALGAGTLKLAEAGGPKTVYGTLNRDRERQLRSSGYRFRRSGLISGVVARKQDERMPPFVAPPTQTSEQAWRAYYAAK